MRLETEHKRGTELEARSCQQGDGLPAAWVHKSWDSCSYHI